MYRAELRARLRLTRGGLVAAVFLLLAVSAACDSRPGESESMPAAGDEGDLILELTSAGGMTGTLSFGSETRTYEPMTVCPDPEAARTPECVGPRLGFATPPALRVPRRVTLVFIGDLEPLSVSMQPLTFYGGHARGAGNLRIVDRRVDIQVPVWDRRDTQLLDVFAGGPDGYAYFRFSLSSYPRGGAAPNRKPSWADEPIPVVPPGVTS